MAAAGFAAEKDLLKGSPDPDSCCAAWLKPGLGLQEEQTSLDRTGRQQHWAQRLPLQGNMAGLCSCSQQAEKPAGCCDAAADPVVEAGLEAGSGSDLGSVPEKAEGQLGWLVELERWSRFCQTL